MFKYIKNIILLNKKEQLNNTLILIYLIILIHFILTTYA